LQDIELLAQSFALRAGEPTHRVEPQLRIGARCGFVSKSEAETLASAYRLLWRLQAAGRLLSDKPLDMAEIGEGGRAFLLREAGAATLETLAARLAECTDAVCSIVEAVLLAAPKSA
jgi:glutamate-ammonia-ligase adenylyltransferase